MSDTSTLNFEYEAAAEFSERVNTNVLIVKRWAIGRAPESPDELTRAKAELATLFDRLAGCLGAVRADLPSVDVPTEVLERLAARHRDQLAYFNEDLAQAAAALRSEETLAERVLGVLEEVSETADATASAWFRRLRRR